MDIRTKRKFKLLREQVRRLEHQALVNTNDINVARRVLQAQIDVEKRAAVFAQHYSQCQVTKLRAEKAEQEMERWKAERLAEKAMGEASEHNIDTAKAAEADSRRA